MEALSTVADRERPAVHTQPTYTPPVEDEFQRVLRLSVQVGLYLKLKFIVFSTWAAAWTLQISCERTSSVQGKITQNLILFYT